MWILGEKIAFYSCSAENAIVSPHICTTWKDYLGPPLPVMSFLRPFSRFLLSLIILISSTSTYNSTRTSYCFKFWAWPSKSVESRMTWVFRYMVSTLKFRDNTAASQHSIGGGQNDKTVSISVRQKMEATASAVGRHPSLCCSRFLPALLPIQSPIQYQGFASASLF